MGVVAAAGGRSWRDKEKESHKKKEKEKGKKKEKKKKRGLRCQTWARCALQSVCDGSQKIKDKQDTLALQTRRNQLFCLPKWEE